jgi:hypothetical protein
MDEVKGPVAFGPGVLSGKPFGEAHDVRPIHRDHHHVTGRHVPLQFGQRGLGGSTVKAFPGIL